MITDRPVAKSSLGLMAGEIKLGQLYLTQSEQLREQLSNDRYHTQYTHRHCTLRTQATFTSFETELSFPKLI